MSNEFAVLVKQEKGCAVFSVAPTATRRERPCAESENFLHYQTSSF